jgi:hypothetical protein
VGKLNKINSFRWSEQLGGLKMGLFDEILNGKPTNELKNEAEQTLQTVRDIDPRPDLQSDSKIWSQLLLSAKDMDQSLEFYGIMHGFRCMGTRLVLMTEAPYRGEYRMRGQFDGTGADHWTKAEDYSAAAIKYLGPANNPNRYGAMLKELLGKLSLKKTA